MSRMIVFLVIAIVLFTVAASASWYLQSQQAKDVDPNKSAEEKPVKASPQPKASGGDTTPSRPLIRPPTSHEQERLTQMASALQSQTESLKAREQQLLVREKQMNIVHDEVRKEQKKLDIVRKEIAAELQLVQEKIAELEKRGIEGEKDRQKVEAQRDELRKAVLEVNPLEQKNLKNLASVYDKMDAEIAAQSIHQMVDSGKLDMVVSILSNMGTRQAANLLGEIFKQDASVAVQLFERMRLLKSPAISSK